MLVSCSWYSLWSTHPTELEPHMSPFKRSLLPLALTVSLIAVGCGGSTNQSSTTRSSTAVDASTTAGATTAGATTTGATTTGATTTAATESSDTGASTTSEASATTAAGGDEGAAAPTAGDCDATAATFRKVSSANDNLDAPELAATCDGDTVVVSTVRERSQWLKNVAANDKTAVWYWGRRHTTTATVRRGPLNVVTLTKNGSKAG